MQLFKSKNAKVIFSKSLKKIKEIQLLIQQWKILGHPSMVIKVQNMKTNTNNLQMIQKLKIHKK